MIFSVFQKNRVLGYSWSTLLWHRCYYPHQSRDALSPVCGIFHYWLFVFFIKKSKKTRKKKKKIWNTLLHVRHQVWHLFGSLWVRGVHWHHLGPHFTPGCPLAPLNLLKVPTDIPWFYKPKKTTKALLGGRSVDRVQKHHLWWNNFYHPFSCSIWSNLSDFFLNFLLTIFSAPGIFLIVRDPLMVKNLKIFPNVVFDGSN